jgi:hypothetical protein
MLRENPQHRPNIYQVVVEVCAMRHRSVPIKDVCLASPNLPYRLTVARYIRTGPNQKTGETNNYRLLSRFPRLQLLGCKRLLPCNTCKQFQILLQ